MMKQSDAWQQHHPEQHILAMSNGRNQLEASFSVLDVEYTEDLPDDESDDVSGGADGAEQNSNTNRRSRGDLPASPSSSVGSRRLRVNMYSASPSAKRRGRSHSAGRCKNNAERIRSAVHVRRKNTSRGRSQTSIISKKTRQVSKSPIPKSPIGSKSPTPAKSSSPTLSTTPAGQQTIISAKERSRRERARRRGVARSKSSDLELLNPVNANRGNGSRLSNSRITKRGVGRRNSDDLSAMLRSNNNSDGRRVASDLQSTAASHEKRTKRRSSSKKKSRRASADTEMLQSSLSAMFREGADPPIFNPSSSQQLKTQNISSEGDDNSHADTDEKEMKRPISEKQARRFSWWALDKPNDTDISPIAPLPPHRRTASVGTGSTLSASGSIQKHFHRTSQHDDGGGGDDRKSTATGSTSKQSTLPTDLDSGNWSTSPSNNTRYFRRSKSPRKDINSHLQRQKKYGDDTGADDLRSTGTGTTRDSAGSGVYSSGSSTNNNFGERRGKKPKRKSIKKHILKQGSAERRRSGGGGADDLRSTATGSTGKHSHGSKQSRSSDGSRSTNKSKNTRMSVKKTTERLKPNILTSSPKNPSSDRLSIASEFTNNDFNPDDGSKQPESFNGEDSFQIVGDDNHHRMTSWRHGNEQQPKDAKKAKQNKKKKQEETNSAANHQVRSGLPRRKSNMKEKKTHHSAIATTDEIPEPFLLSPPGRSKSLGDPFALSSARDLESGSGSFGLDDDTFGDIGDFHQSVAF